MFVRWKRKRRKDSSHWERPDPDTRAVRVYTPEFLLSAVVVESVRIDGKPRQRTIKYLGSIRECKLDPDNKSGIFHHGYFWRSVDANLAELELPESERVRIVAILEDTVPRPDPEARARAWQETEDRLASIVSMTGGSR